MKSLGLFSTLRMRLIALTSLIVLFISIFQASFYPQRLRNSLRRHMEERLVSLATATASNIAAAIEFDDQKTAQEVLEGLTHVSDFAYAVVFRAGGGVMAQALRIERGLEDRDEQHDQAGQRNQAHAQRREQPQRLHREPFTDTPLRCAAGRHRGRRLPPCWPAG